MSDLAVDLIAAAGPLASLGRRLVESLGPLELETAALLAGALVLDHALARRARASWRIALYAPLALRLLVPLGWTVPLDGAPRVATLLAPLARIGAGAAATVDANGGSGSSWYALAAVVYLAGAAGLGAHAVLARLRLRRVLAGARPVARSFPGVPCPVVEHEHLGPMAVGLLAPRVVLPARLLAGGDEGALACVLRHEAAHLRRRDAWLAAAVQALTVVAWPLVPVWIAAARVRHLVELACDEAALAGADAAERRRYGHALLDLAEWRSLIVAPLAAGELHFGSTLRARIEALADRRHWPAAAQALVLSLAPVALFAACSGSASLPQPAASGDSDDYGYAFESDPAKNVAPGRAASAGPPARPRDAVGRIPPETIQAAVRSRFGAMKSCYEAGLARNPALAGRVTVKYVIARDGTTMDAADEGSTLPDREVVACVVGEFRKLTYPRPDDGYVTVVYPVEFSP